MKSSRMLLLLGFLLLAAPCCLHAQIGRADEFAWQDAIPPYYPPPRPWVPAMEPAPRFPLTVRVRLEYSRYTGINYVGGGEAHVFNPRGEDLAFSYRCGLTFSSYRALEFQARWIKPDKKLEILLQQPGTNHTRTCRLTTAAPAATLQTAYTP